MPAMPWLEDQWRLDVAAREAIAALLAPRARLGFAIDVYDAGIRLASDGLRTLARLLDVEPVRTIATLSADVTRDLGAAQVSSARWRLDA